MLDSSCHPPLPPAGGLPVCTGPDFKKKKKKDRGKSAGQASTRNRSFRHSRRFPERHSWFQRFSRSNLRRSQCADVALRDGTRVEGPRGFGMDTPGPLGPALPPLLLNTRAKNLFDLKTRGLEEF